jgi:hypothetical protein
MHEPRPADPIEGSPATDLPGGADPLEESLAREDVCRTGVRVVPLNVNVNPDFSQNGHHATDPGTGATA